MQYSPEELIGKKAFYRNPHDVARTETVIKNVIKTTKGDHYDMENGDTMVPDSHVTIVL